jgi:hypothetical protein
MGLFGKRKSSPAQRRAAMSNMDPNYPGDFDRCKVGEVESLIHFLDDKPLGVCFEHRKSSACLGYTITPATVTPAFDVSFSEDCPLCRSGEKPELYFVYNVVVLAQSRGPRFSQSAILMDGPAAAPYRRPALKLLFAPPGYRIDDKPRNVKDEDVYHLATKVGAFSMTADRLLEGWRTRPLMR